MKYQEKIFFTSQDIATAQDAQSAEFKPVANDSKYMFQEETEKKRNHRKFSYAHFPGIKTIYLISSSFLGILCVQNTILEVLESDFSRY